ncbi:MAG: hypothetical protein P8188_07400 [Gemmatimonadota bacterium]
MHRNASPRPRVLFFGALILLVAGCGTETAEQNAADREPTGECARPAADWIWCDDFEEDRLERYFEYDDGDGAFVRVPGVGLGDSHGMRVAYRQGVVSHGALHVAFGRTPQPYFRPVDEGRERYRALYWRLYLRYPEDWVGHGGDKLTRATVFASPDHWGQAMIAHVWSGGIEGGTGSHLVLDPASGTRADGTLATTAYNDFPNLRWLGLASSSTPIFEPPYRGEWHCVEAHVSLGEPGAGDGEFRLWIDGRREAERTGLDWMGSFQEYGLNALFVENYWNDGAPATQERYLDNLVVSTERIGCAPTEASGLTPP